MESQAQALVGTKYGNRRIQLLACLLLATLTAAGCATSGGALDKTMQAMGLKSDAAALGKDKPVPLRLFAGDNLNAGSGKRGMALVLRVYHLRSLQRFEQAPFDAFLDEAREKTVLGDDLLGSTEILLMPGQKHELVETVAGGASHLGVVALFRSPAASRWRFSFDAGKAVKDGITLGMHACAMTTTSTALITTLADEPYSLASVNCAAKR